MSDKEYTKLYHRHLKCANLYESIFTTTEELVVSNKFMAREPPIKFLSWMSFQTLCEQLANEQ